MMTLGIETSCDETAVSVVEGGRVLSSEVSSSVHLHSEYGGVVPEIASRYHVEYILPVMRKALEDAGAGLGDIELIAVTCGPGLPGSLLVGLAFAKALSLATGMPVLGVDHLQAHVMSCFLGDEGPGIEDAPYPFTGMVISGGHTNIYRCSGPETLSLEARTRDDAVGEAFDKVAKILSLGYPGGPRVEERASRYGAAECPEDLGFPRAMLKESDGLDFSFSGIKTAVMYYWKGASGSEAEKDMVCYSFQKAMVDVIKEKARRAVRSFSSSALAVGGGVINNTALRSALEEMCREEGVRLFLPRREFCGDNAAMIAALGESLFRRGRRSGPDLNASPSGIL